MSTLREAAQQALEELEDYKYAEARDALRAALAEPVQEPVAWIHTDPDKRRVKFLEWRENEPGYRGDWIKTPLYTAPPQRKPLTEDQLDDIAVAARTGNLYDLRIAIDRAHGIT